MLALAKIMEVQRLLADGHLSIRKISAATGVSRTTISGIASGRRPDYEALRRARLEEYQPSGPLARCAECGGLVYTPCRLCRLRKAKEKEQDRLRELRRKARQMAARQLLVAVWRASQERDARLNATA